MILFGIFIWALFYSHPIVALLLLVRACLK
jgi:hypothetical protein